MTYDNHEARKTVYPPNKLPTSLERKIYIHYSISGFEPGKIEIWDCDLSGENRILLTTMMVKIKIPPKGDLKADVIKALENEIQKIRAESYAKIQQLQERVDSLLALEYRPPIEALAADKEIV